MLAVRLVDVREATGDRGEVNQQSSPLVECTQSPDTSRRSKRNEKRRGKREKGKSEREKKTLSSGPDIIAAEAVREKKKIACAVRPPLRRRRRK